VNVTVPVGVPPPGLVGNTVAENVTGWHKADELFDELTEVLVDDLLTNGLAVAVVVE
jgi:hypothetical protein